MRKYNLRKIVASSIATLAPYSLSNESKADLSIGDRFGPGEITHIIERPQGMTEPVRAICLTHDNAGVYMMGRDGTLLEMRLDGQEVSSYTINDPRLHDGDSFNLPIGLARDGDGLVLGTRNVRNSAKKGSIFFFNLDASTQPYSIDVQPLLTEITSSDGRVYASAASTSLIYQFDQFGQVANTLFGPSENTRALGSTNDSFYARDELNGKLTQFTDTLTEKEWQTDQSLWITNLDVLDDRMAMTVTEADGDHYVAVVQIPEPASLAFLAAGAGAAIVSNRKKR